ncbi:MAG: ABC transporter substrate-binding protein [Actinomycetota bacterium]
MRRHRHHLASPTRHRTNRTLGTAAVALLVSVSCGSSDTAGDTDAADGDEPATASATTAADAASTTGTGAGTDGDASTTSTQPPADDEVEPDDTNDTSDAGGAPAEDTAPEDDEDTAPEASDTGAVEFPVTVVDALGFEHTFDEPARVGCVVNLCREAFAGFGEPPAATPFEASDFFFPAGPPEFVVTDINDLEAWAGADIDVAVFGGPANQIHEIASDVTTVFFVHTPGRTNDGMTGIEAVAENHRLLGTIADRLPEAEADIERLERAIATARSFSTPELADRTVVNLFNGAAYLMEFGDGDTEQSTAFCSVLLEAALGSCAEVDILAQEISAEAFLELDPDVIAMQAGTLSVETRDDPIWERLSAVQNGLAYDSSGTGYRFASARSLIWALQEFVHFTVPGSGIPAPGPLDDFVPEASPLVS